MSGKVEGTPAGAPAPAVVENEKIAPAAPAATEAVQEKKANRFDAADVRVYFSTLSAIIPFTDGSISICLDLAPNPYVSTTTQKAHESDEANKHALVDMSTIELKAEDLVSLCANIPPTPIGAAKPFSLRGRDCMRSGKGWGRNAGSSIDGVAAVHNSDTSGLALTVLPHPLFSPARPFVRSLFPMAWHVRIR